MQEHPKTPIFVLPSEQDRMSHFHGDHWGVRLAALWIDTLPKTVKGLGLVLIGLGLLAWKFWP